MTKDGTQSLKTEFTEKFDIEHPILNAGMGWVAMPNMVAAVSNAGGLGVLGAGSQPPDKVRDAIREIRSLTDRPFGINCPLALPNARDNAKVAIEEQVPVINYSMGKGDWIAEAVAKYGGKSIASLNSVDLALSAQRNGADAVIAAGHEAAGHAGEVTTFVLVPRLVEVLDIPVVAAGGIANGSGLLAALALGAGAVSMGTRFATCAESTIHDAFKEAALELDVHDTIYSNKFDGHPCRMLATDRAKDVVEAQVNPFAAFSYSFSIARDLNISYPRMLWNTIKNGPKATMDMMRMGITLRDFKTSFKGDLKKGSVGGGQSVGLIHDNPTAAEIIDRVMSEARAAQRRIGGQW